MKKIFSKVISPGYLGIFFCVILFLKSRKFILDVNEGDIT